MNRLWFAFFLALLVTPAAAQNSPAPAAVPIGPACAWIAHDNPKLQPVAQVCEVARSMRQTLPNFICDQKTRRSQPVPVMNVGRPSYREGVDVITAQVTYENGEERFANIAMNGHPTETVSPNSGMWSEGEFSPMVLTVLDPGSAPEIQYRGEMEMDATPVLAFEYSIEKKNNLLWVFRIGGKDYLPAFRGMLYIDRDTGHLRRLVRKASELDSWIGYKMVADMTDYANVDITGLGKFRLPVRSEAVGCQRNPPFCSHNVLTFQNCRKFAGKARIITDSPQP